jgi:hypothetical protein
LDSLFALIMGRLIGFLLLFCSLTVLGQNKEILYKDGTTSGKVKESNLKVDANGVFNWWQKRDSSSRWGADANGIFYGFNALERFRVNNDGRVMVGGITNRYSKLNVLGGVSADSLKLSSTNATTAFTNHATQTSNLSIDANGTVVNTINPLTIGNMYQVAYMNGRVYDGTSVKWTGLRFLPYNKTNADGVTYIDISMPSVGTVISGLGGSSNQTVTANGIPLSLEVLLYNLTTNTFHILGYTSSVKIPDNCVIICVSNNISHNGSYCVRWATGEYQNTNEDVRVEEVQKTSTSIRNGFFYAQVLGGGNKKYNGVEVYWDGPFRSMPTTPTGWMEIPPMPSVGTIIQGLGGTANVTVNANGIPLTYYSSLYYRFSTATFHIIGNTPLKLSNDYVFVVASGQYTSNGIGSTLNDNYVKWVTGELQYANEYIREEEINKKIGEKCTWNLTSPNTWYTIASAKAGGIDSYFALNVAYRQYITFKANFDGYSYLGTEKINILSHYRTYNEKYIDSIRICVSGYESVIQVKTTNQASTYITAFIRTESAAKSWRYENALLNTQNPVGFTGTVSTFLVTGKVRLNGSEGVNDGDGQMTIGSHNVLTEKDSAKSRTYTDGLLSLKEDFSQKNEYITPSIGWYDIATCDQVGKAEFDIYSAGVNHAVKVIVDYIAGQSDITVLHNQFYRVGYSAFDSIRMSGETLQVKCTNGAYVTVKMNNRKNPRFTGGFMVIPIVPGTSTATVSRQVELGAIPMSINNDAIVKGKQYAYLTTTVDTLCNANDNHFAFKLPLNLLGRKITNVTVTPLSSYSPTWKFAFRVQRITTGAPILLYNSTTVTYTGIFYEVQPNVVLPTGIGTDYIYISGNAYNNVGWIRPADKFHINIEFEK